MHRHGDLGIDRGRRFRGFFRRHHISPRNRKQRDVALDGFHLGSKVGISGEIDRRPVHADQEAQTFLSLRMKRLARLAKLVDVVRGNGFHLHFTGLRVADRQPAAGIEKPHFLHLDLLQPFFAERTGDDGGAGHDDLFQVFQA